MAKEKKDIKYRIVSVRVTEEEALVWEKSAVELATMLGKPISFSAFLRLVMNTHCKKETP